MNIIHYSYWKITSDLSHWGYVTESHHPTKSSQDLKISSDLSEMLEWELACRVITADFKPLFQDSDGTSAKVRMNLQKCTVSCNIKTLHQFNWQIKNTGQSIYVKYAVRHMYAFQKQLPFTGYWLYNRQCDKHWCPWLCLILQKPYSYETNTITVSSFVDEKTDHDMKVI